MSQGANRFWLRPPLMLGRGLVRLAAAAGRGWRAAPADRRGPLLVLAAGTAVLLAVVPYGPPAGGLLLLAAALAAGWRDRTGPPGVRPPAEGDEERLQTLYESLVPYFAPPGPPAGGEPPPEAMYLLGGGWERGIEEYAFGLDDRLARLLIRYPGHFPDGDPQARDRVERLLAAKTGGDRELRFRWDEERNRLEMTVPGPLPAGICAQRFIMAPGELVLGFTDTEAVDRLVPVAADGEAEPVHAAPVVWRTGPRSPAPHLLAVGPSGSGTTSLLRSVTLQALRDGEVLLIDGGGAGEFGCFTGRRGVLSVESSPSGARAALEWAARETGRRLLEVSRARQAGGPQRAVRPLWIVLDRPSLLGHPARPDGSPGAQQLLEVPLRYGRAARVTVAVAEDCAAWEELSEAVRTAPGARVVLGSMPAAEIRFVLDGPLPSAPPPVLPPGRGYARLGPDRAVRLQVPATPDPQDDTASETQRRAVRALLPEPVLSLDRRSPAPETTGIDPS
ncbi:hypothetical protein [Streptomyces aidingensis]|uniref:YD repeat-containing protein n=1 Tax=Streptomyces aidingensis TaxID=910347 RepID=A0A1I1MWN1_9ACTN|nr:hypothetical protein [Streptomyces aidingensis]SFC89807.1 YD repeat-containing protein [Streptomyces aidingensis]